MVDRRVLAAADAAVGPEIDRGTMTEAQRAIWLEVARESYRQLFGELPPRVHWDLVMASHGIAEAPPDHPFYSDGTTITIVTAEQAARQRKQLNMRKDAPDARK